MTTSIYSNPFAYEKLGPHFKEYLQLCRKHINDEKGKNTSRHHINPKFLTGDYIEDRWNWVHLEHEDHREAHRLLHLVFPEKPDARSAYNLLKGELSQSEAQRKRYEDPLERKKTGEANRKRYEDPLEREKSSEAARKRYEDPLERKKSSETAKKWHAEVGFSEETIQILREAATGENNPMFGKPSANRGKTPPTETKQKMREAKLGKTPWNKGKKEKRVICEHCGEDVAVSTYKRSHGDKCKKKET